MPRGGTDFGIFIYLIVVVIKHKNKWLVIIMTLQYWTHACNFLSNVSLICQCAAGPWATWWLPAEASTRWTFINFLSPSLYTVHPSLCTVHPSLYTVHCCPSVCLSVCKFHTSERATNHLPRTPSYHLGESLCYIKRLLMAEINLQKSQWSKCEWRIGRWLIDWWAKYCK